MGRYLGEYLRKDWESRLLEDKGARCVRYFGHWSKEPRKKGGGKGTPPHKSRFGWLTPRASVWREMVKQTVIVLNHNGAKITEQNIKDVIGPRWAWKMAKLFPAVAFIDGDWQSNPVQGEIAKHNADVRFNWVAGGGDPARQCWWYVTEITLDHLRPSPKWKKENEELELAKECEAMIERVLKSWRNFGGRNKKKYAYCERSRNYSRRIGPRKRRSGQWTQEVSTVRTGWHLSLRLRRQSIASGIDYFRRHQYNKVSRQSGRVRIIRQPGVGGKFPRQDHRLTAREGCLIGSLYRV